jgi:hypothetical protein
LFDPRVINAASRSIVRRLQARRRIPRHHSAGWFWANGGMEVPRYSLLISLTILNRGGGPLSLDRSIGREI